jgi:AraC-like DNA-binding protein
VFFSPAKHPSRTLNEHIISYVIKGGWELEVGTEMVIAKSDCVFIQPANIPHVGTKNCPPETHTMFVHFSVEEGDECAKADFLQESEDYAYINTLVDGKNNSAIKKVLLKIIEEYAKGNNAKASSYLNVLLCELAEASLYDKSKYGMGRNIKKMLATTDNEFYSNKEIAMALGVSVRNAETTFKELFGKTIHQYQLEQKIERAKFYLEYYPKMKIIDVSLGLGFYDEFHFSKQFKKLTGISPSEYRKSVLKEKLEKAQKTRLV